MLVIDKRVLGALLGGILLAAALVVVGLGAPAAETRGSVSGLEASSDTAGVLDVEWNQASPEPTDYRVSWALEGSSYRTWSNRSGNAYPRTESHEVSGLVEGAIYKVKVRARYFETPQSTSPLWSGPWTDEVTVTINNQPPSAPTELTASSVTHDSVTLTWTAPDSGTVTGYRVFRGADATSLSVIADDTAGIGTTFTDSTVAAATEYVYAVLALSLDGDGAESDILSVTTPAGLTGDTERSVENTNDENDVNDVEVITATFPQPSFVHDGLATFDFHVDFSHQPEDMGYKTFKYEALSVQGASVGRVWRRVSGSHQFWAAKVTPDGYGDINITINGTTNCSDEHAVCDSQGIMLLGGDQHVIHGPLTLSLSEPVVQEDLAATLDFVVSLNRAGDQAVTVDYQAEDGTATAGADYTATSGSLTFDVGQTEKTVSVPVLENGGDLDRESVVFHLSSPSGAILIDEFAVGTIVDLAVSSQQETNLSPPSVSVADALVLEGPGATLDFAVSLSHVSDQAVSVTYRTERGTGDGVALPGYDYHAASGRLTFDPGQTEQTVSVRVSEDEKQDGRETLRLLLTSAVGATFAGADATGTILNTPEGRRQPSYYGHNRPDWSPGQIFPTSVTSTEDHTIDLAWTTPISYIAYKFRVNFAPVDPEIAGDSFPWEGAEDGNHWFITHSRLLRG